MQSLMHWYLQYVSLQCSYDWCKGMEPKENDRAKKSGFRNAISMSLLKTSLVIVVAKEIKERNNTLTDCKVKLNI